MNVLEWPSQSLSLNPIKYFWRNLKRCVCPIQPDRAWEVKRRGEEWQIIAKFWCAKIVVSYPKRLEAVKVLQLSTGLRVWILMQCAYFSFLFLINLRSCNNSVFALSLWCMELECRLMWGKSNSKEFNIRLQHNKMCKKWRGVNTFYRHCTLESAYVYRVYIVSHVNLEKNNKIHMLRWKFVPQSNNNKNACRRR